MYLPPSQNFLMSAIDIVVVTTAVVTTVTVKKITHFTVVALHLHCF